MVSRPLTFLFGFLVVGGCTAPVEDRRDDDVGDSAEALSPGSLRARTALDRIRDLEAEEGSIRVDYAPPEEGYESSDAHGVSFEPVKFEGSDDHKVVSVAGNFPSVATVVVTDAQFHVLAVKRTNANADGVAQANVRIPSGKGERFVLVRDPKWVKPMSFDVHVAR